MPGAGKEEEEAHLNTIHHCAFCHPKSSFKPTSLDVVSEIYKMAQLQVKKIETFSGYTDEEEWPMKMTRVCEYMLSTTIFNRELTEGTGNDN